MSRPIAGRGRRRARGERGAVLVEAALVIPVLLFLAFGVVEYGAAFGDRNLVDTAGRAGGRAVANMSNDKFADYWALDAVVSAINDLGLTNVTRVVIFKATTNPVISAGCAAGTPSSSAQACNVYSNSVITNLYTTNYKTNNFGCGVGKLDNYWCPAPLGSPPVGGRNITGTTADYVGIYIEAKHAKLTYVLPGDLTIKDTFITRLEPSP
jgi:Flp pilus assembly protein TadG